MPDYEPYEPITTEEFDGRLAYLVDLGQSEELLAIPGVYEILSEHYNNRIRSEYEEASKQFLPYEDVVHDFQDNILPGVIERYGKDDEIAVNEAWNDYTDQLREGGQISDYAYNNWEYDYNPNKR